MTIMRFHRLAVSAAVAAALGFGGAQALPAPAEAAGAACDRTTCNRKCQANGYAGGVCLQSGQCVCYIITP